MMCCIPTCSAVWVPGTSQNPEEGLCPRCGEDDILLGESVQTYIDGVDYRNVDFVRCECGLVYDSSIEEYKKDVIECPQCGKKYE
jgi:ssDNA-binding Zn-finger/Zn-ribbon topoisomerase 1